MVGLDEAWPSQPPKSGQRARQPLLNSLADRMRFEARSQFTSPGAQESWQPLWLNTFETNIEDDPQTNSLAEWRCWGYKRLDKWHQILPNRYQIGLITQRQNSNKVCLGIALDWHQGMSEISCKRQSIAKARQFGWLLPTPTQIPNPWDEEIAFSNKTPDKKQLSETRKTKDVGRRTANTCQF